MDKSKQLLMTMLKRDLSKLTNIFIYQYAQIKN